MSPSLLGVALIFWEVVFLKLNIRPLSVNVLSLGEPAELDLFDAQGCLLLEKGKTVTKDIIERAQIREVYGVTYDWIKSRLETIIALDIGVNEQNEAELVKGVAKDRIVFTIDPEMRHGRKSSCKRCAHIAIDEAGEFIN